MLFNIYLMDAFCKIIEFLKVFFTENLGISQDIVDKIFGAI